MQEDECIPIQLKRRLSYKHYYSYEFVRPKKVMEAIEWLVKNSTLYKEEGIQIDQEWLEHDMQTLPDEQLAGNDQCEAHDKAHDSDEEEEYENEELNAGPHDTLLDSHDLLEDSRDILSVAPGEGNFPISVFLDTNAESLSFPSLFCGKEMKRPNDYTTKVHYSDLCKSELRRSDRRVAGHMPDIFKMKKLQMKHILDKASICLRKTYRKSHDLTAGFLKSAENLKSVLQSDLGFRIFKELRGSPPYWEKVKKDLFTLIRILGIPTWFASFSSADTHWSHLLQILGQTVDKKSYSEDEVNNFSWFKKQSLVKKDPVTCARHFDFQVRTLMKDVLQNPSHPIGEIIDFFYKIEFQMRGSPHVHMLLWIKDAPKIGQNDVKKILEFIDNHVSCEKSSQKSQLINLQVHSHSRTCKKNNKPICRFNFPIPPMIETATLEPLPEDTDVESARKHRCHWDKIANFLKKFKKDMQDLEFGDFLKELGLSLEDYILAIRSSLKSKKLFLKRQPGEVYVNNYNSVILECWRANMDLQYICMCHVHRQLCCKVSAWHE